MGDNDIDVWRFEPLSMALSTTLTFAFTALTGAVKPALFDPAGTVTLAGNAMLAVVWARVTARPPAGAEPFSVTVQETLPAPAIAAGLQDNADTWRRDNVIDEVCFVPLAVAVIAA